MKKSEFYKMLEDSRTSALPLDLKEAIYVLVKKYPVFSIGEVSEKLCRDPSSIMHLMNVYESKELKNQ